MIARRPDIEPQLVELQSGRGVAGGPRNPIGARGMYLWQGNKDTLFRIHGTIEPHTIGQSVSSGCIRMINQDVIHLYARVAGRNAGEGASGQDGLSRDSTVTGAQRQLRRVVRFRLGGSA